MWDLYFDLSFKNKKHSKYHFKHSKLINYKLLKGNVSLQWSDLADWAHINHRIKINIPNKGIA